MYHFENICLENAPAHFKPFVYRQLVEDTFLLTRTKDHVEKFKNEISCHMQFYNGKRNSKIHQI